jgi:hypothetical protein
MRIASDSHHGERWARKNDRGGRKRNGVIEFALMLCASCRRAVDRLARQQKFCSAGCREKGTLLGLADGKISSKAI